MRFVGIDYGQRRIGLAVSDPTGLLARPLKTIARTGNRVQVADTIAREIAAVAEEEGELGGVVIGLPRKLGGEATDQTAAVRALAADLGARVRWPIVLQDERLSSREAESLLARRIKDWKQRKPLVDAMAASVILQDYLDGRPSAPPVDSDEETPGT